MCLPACSMVNESLFIPATSWGFDLPRLGSVYSTVPGNERIFSSVSVLCFQGTTERGVFPDQRVHSQKQVAEEVNMGGQRQLKKMRLSLSLRCLISFLPSDLPSSSLPGPFSVLRDLLPEELDFLRREQVGWDSPGLARWGAGG